MSGLFELFERGDAEPIVNPLGQLRPDAGNGRQKLFRRDGAFEALGHRKTPRRRELVNSGSKSGPIPAISPLFALLARHR